jgi:hypothetical protein
MQAVNLDEMGVKLFNDNSVLLKRLFYLGEYEASEWRWWREWREHASHVVEFAANAGLYSVVDARAPSITQHVAIEPHPYTAAVLRQGSSLTSNGGVAGT